MTVRDEWVRIPYKSAPGVCGSKIEVEIAQREEDGIGFQVWNAAPVLCDYFVKTTAVGADSLRQRRVLELGSGTGLVGIVCAHLGYDVTLTDMASVLPVLRLNADNNSPAGLVGILRVQELHWGTDVRVSFPRARFDLVIGSDVTYFGHLHKPLLLTLLQLADESTEILLAHAHRHDEFESWLDMFEEHFEVSAVSSCSLGSDDERSEFVRNGTGGASAETSVPITVYRLQLRGPPLADGAVTRLLERANQEDTETLLARISKLEADLATMAVCEEDGVHEDQSDAI